MALMNTCTDDVPLSTWRASREQEHRIDYTAMSMEDSGRVLHAGAHKDVDMAFSAEIDHWPVSMQVRARAHREITSKPSAGVHAHASWMVRNAPSRDSTCLTTLCVGEKHLLLNGPRKQWVSQLAFQMMREAWTAKDELRDARQWFRPARLAPVFLFLSDYSAASAQQPQPCHRFPVRAQTANVAR